MFICMDSRQCTGQGQTLEKAYKDYGTYHGYDSLDECRFFKAEEVNVEIKLQRVEIVVKDPAKHG